MERPAWRRWWWQPGFTLSLLVVGLPYWFIPYNKVNLPDALLTPGLIAVALAAGLTRWLSGRSFWRCTAAIGAAVPAAVMLRVAAEVAQKPASHNLWPFEVVIAVIVGGVAAAVGAGIVSAGLWLARRGGGAAPDE